MRSLTMKVLLAAGLSTLALVLASCGGGSIEAAAPPPALAITVSVSPPSVTVLTGATQQFTATVTPSSNSSVSWTIDAAGSGNATVGMISASGLYTAPLIPPSPSNTVTVRATSVADSSKSGTASLAVNNPQPSLTSISPDTVDAGSGTLAVTVSGSGFSETAYRPARMKERWRTSPSANAAGWTQAGADGSAWVSLSWRNTRLLRLAHAGRGWRRRMDVPTTVCLCSLALCTVRKSGVLSRDCS